MAAGGVGLYELLLGESWGLLPEVLRRVHGRDTQVVAVGEMDVTLGRSMGAGLIRRALRMPTTEGRMPVELRVTRSGQREHWDRRIGPWRLRTEQWAEDGLIIESYGPLLFPMVAAADEDALTLSSAKMMLSVRGRRFLAPSCLSIRTSGVERQVGAGPGELSVNVRIEMPWGQLLVGYHGTLRVIPE